MKLGCTEREGGTGSQIQATHTSSDVVTAPHKNNPCGDLGCLACGATPRRADTAQGRTLCVNIPWAANEDTIKVFQRESFEKGLQSGPAVAYYPDGKPMREENYQHGVLHGRCRYYRPDGTLEREQTYRSGERAGAWVYYDLKGKPQHRYTFWNDAVYSGQ